MNLIGLTIGEALQKIRAYEKGRIFTYYVVVESYYTKDYKQFFKRNHLYNKEGKRIYKIIDFKRLYFAEHKELEKDTFIIDVRIEKGEHINMSFSGATSNGTHNEYYLIVDHLQKGNKGKPQIKKLKEQEIEYKEGELTKAQRRITL